MATRKLYDYPLEVQNKLMEACHKMRSSIVLPPHTHIRGRRFMDDRYCAQYALELGQEMSMHPTEGELEDYARTGLIHAAWVDAYNEEKQWCDDNGVNDDAEGC